MVNIPNFDFANFVPNNDWMKQLTQTYQAGMASWLTPSIDPEELEKRINELKAVHFWLEQNKQAIGMTIQTLEVQKMTLLALKNFKEEMGKKNLTPGDEGIKPAATEKPMDSGNEGGPSSIHPKIWPALPQTPHPSIDWWNAVAKQFSQIVTDTVQSQSTGKDSSSTSPAAPATNTKVSKKKKG
ncbi:MAG: hypothetical protein QM520_01485 [Gammaproteobacteria bacterium]|nr:hypothetical protein [Gammaproteobacteria bacterium]